MSSPTKVWESWTGTAMSQDFLGKGMISSELSEKWVRMIGFRNPLVHGYMDVDRTIVFEVLQNGLGDIEDLKRVFARHL